MSIRKLNNVPIMTLLFDLFRLLIVFAIYVTIVEGFSNTAIGLITLTIVFLILLGVIRFFSNINDEIIKIDTTKKLEYFNSDKSIRIVVLYFIILVLMATAVGFIAKTAGSPYDIGLVIILVVANANLQRIVKDKMNINRFSYSIIRVLFPSITIHDGLKGVLYLVE